MARPSFVLAAVRIVGPILLAGAACGGASPRAGGGYEEYECPAPVGPIVREDCAQSALRYDAIEFSGSVGVSGVAEGSASYKETALRQADRLVAMLKEHRVALCNDFNTCKLTTTEYREEKGRLDDSFVALAALQDRVEQMDAEGASRLLAELQAIRSRVTSSGGSASPTTSPDGATSVVTFAGHRYQRLGGTRTWHEARDLCAAKRAHLVTVGSAEENAFVERSFGQGHTVWLGATDEGHEGDFRWITGEPMTFKNFASGEPNDHEGKEHYLHLGTWASSDEQHWAKFGAAWNDIAAEGLLFDRPIVHAVCEWE